jgi:hypothetical protein
VVSDIRQLPETGPDMNQAAFGVCFGPAFDPGLFFVSGGLPAWDRVFGFG